MLELESFARYRIYSFLAYSSLYTVSVPALLLGGVALFVVTDSAMQARRTGLAHTRNHLGLRAHPNRRAKYVNAPYWTYGGACAVKAALNSFLPKAGAIVVVEMALDPVVREDVYMLVRDFAITDYDYKVARQVLQHHLGRIRSAEGATAQLRAAGRFKKTLNAKACAHARVSEVASPARVPCLRTVEDYRSSDPSLDRHRASDRSLATRSFAAAAGLRGRPGAIAPERAKSRVRREASPNVVHLNYLPTLTAGRADCWWWLDGDRYFSIEEAARACGVPEGGPLVRALAEGGGLSPIVALGALGQGVHGCCFLHVFEDAVADLRASSVGDVFTYGAAYVGVDTACAAIYPALQALGEQGLPWRYAFAAEGRSDLARALLAAWGEHGLAADCVVSDAQHLAFQGFGPVTLFVCTPDCRHFSRRNQAPTRAEQAATLANLEAALKYVREQLPLRVIVENVAEMCVMLPISAILGRLRDYIWTRVTLCPYRHFGVPTMRLRSYWTGRLVGTVVAASVDTTEETVVDGILFRADTLAAAPTVILDAVAVGPARACASEPRGRLSAAVQLRGQRVIDFEKKAFAESFRTVLGTTGAAREARAARGRSPS